nr:MAG TPA: hypothetical protein [Caudoviricetes sp.]
MSNISINNFTIEKIVSVKAIDTGIGVIQKNIPDAIEVSHKKYKAFCRNKVLSSELVTFADRVVSRDEYDNAVAIVLVGYDKPNTYYINPELYKMGQEQRRHIENVCGQVREPRTVLYLNEVKSFELK